jgi:mannose-6-phosphate isomerase-like protein (cupin superfamily)
MAIMVTRTHLPGSDTSHQFQGGDHGDTAVSFIWIESTPGKGPLLHTHPYDEVFIVLEGSATYTLGDETLVANTGDIVVGPANVPHKFVNNGPGVLRQIDIHASGQFVTEWLED